MSTEQDKTGIVRDEKGRIVKGSGSLNPSGRTKGVSAYIREKTNDLQEVIDIVIEMLRKPADKQELQFAVNYLTDRSIGKPKVYQEINLDTDISIGLPSDLEEKDF